MKGDWDRNARVAPRIGFVSAVTDAGAGVRIKVRLTPRASREEIGGVRDGALQVRVTAPPAENKANAALCKLLAKQLSVAKGRVSVVGGGKSRDKVVQVEGVGEGEVRAKLGLGPG